MRVIQIHEFHNGKPGEMWRDANKIWPIDCEGWEQGFDVCLYDGSVVRAEPISEQQTERGMKHIFTCGHLTLIMWKAEPDSHTPWK